MDPLHAVIHVCMYVNHVTYMYDTDGLHRISNVKLHAMDLLHAVTHVCMYVNHVTCMYDTDR